MAKYSYILVMPVPKDKIEAWRKVGALSGKIYVEHGALACNDWIADPEATPMGEVTGFQRSVHATEDEVIGVGIVKRAVEAPLRALAANAGEEGSVIVDKVKKAKGNEGYNVATGQYEDLVKAGVVDPKKVTRSALQNAASIAGLLLTTECLITDMPEKEKAPAGGGGHGGGMGDMGGMGGY